MKKCAKLPWIVLSLMISSSPAAASPYGFYLAGNLGIFQADFNQSYLDQTDVIPEDIQLSVNQQGYTGGIAIGYRQPCRNFLLGGELLVNADGHNAEFASGASTAAFTDTTQIQYHGDLTLIPGIQLTDCLSAYLKLGLSLAFIQDSLTSPVGYVPEFATFNSSHYRLGFAAGIGVSQSLPCNFSLFAEANYHDYGTVTFPNFLNFTADYTHTAHIYSYNLVVGLAWQFA